MIKIFIHILILFEFLHKIEKRKPLITAAEWNTINYYGFTPQF